MNELKLEEFWEDLGNSKSLTEMEFKLVNNGLIEYNIKWIRSFNETGRTYNEYRVHVELKSDSNQAYEDEIIFEQGKEMTALDKLALEIKSFLLYNIYM